MSALENAKGLSREQVIEKVSASNLQEYGVRHEKLSDCFAAAIQESIEEGKELSVVAALNNADTSGVLLDILRTEPVKVMEGISIAAYAMGTEKMVLHIPEYEEQLAETVKPDAEQYGINVVTGLVNIRESKGSLLLHIVTALQLAELFLDTWQKGFYVSVNGAPLQKVTPAAKISDLADSGEAKAIQAGYQYYLPAQAGMTVEEAQIDNGVLKILTDQDCVVSETEKHLAVSRKQSCGKCVFCREGLLQLHHMQKEITEGRGKMEFTGLTKEIGGAMAVSTPCTMGQVSSKLALTAVELFEEEYKSHIKKKNCPAGVCSSFVNIYIDPSICEGCGECADVCPKECIEGKPKYIHMIDDFDCDKCGKCIEACDADAIIQTAGKVPKLPNRLTKVGKFRRH